ncbi:hypothetical protein [Paracerasibacillus soli]|uniref:Two-component sensor histidine kinase n=1 Tax=Paracerasibacillus soli TaxID=480284 RepID=A0ABU5CU97_9BACI|nr:hypothetical protein [Virgibacillus soli]MDY0408998.1 hypothetical protein [Virgibacillus soli]
MKNLLLFECKKTMKSLYFIMMLLALIVFVSFYFIYSYVHTERVDDYIYKNETIKSNFQSTVDELSSTEGNAANEKEIEFFIDEIAELDMLSEAARNHDWKTILQHEIDIGEEQVRLSPSQAEENVYTWPTHFTNEVVYEKNKWLMKHHIQPIFPIHNNSEITAYDRVSIQLQKKKLPMIFIISTIHLPYTFYILLLESV